MKYLLTNNQIINKQLLATITNCANFNFEYATLKQYSKYL